jgi:condensin complex subunit 2
MDDSNATDPSEARVFSSVISGLQKSYPRDKMDEISTSFCFICLLHLANEQGLKLESAPDEKLPSVFEETAVDDDEDLSTVDKQVGNLWNLKVRAYILLHSVNLIN